jgi:hypothetical protein
VRTIGTNVHCPTVLCDCVDIHTNSHIQNLPQLDLDLIDLDIDVDGLVTLCEPYLGSQNPNLDVNDIIGANDSGISHRK